MVNNNIEHLVDASIAAEERVIAKERTGWWISRLGNCPTGQYLERQGVLPSAPLDLRTLRVFHVGNVFETWILKLIGDQPETKVEEQVRVEDKKLHVSGRIDAVVTQPLSKEIVEVKTKHSKAFWYMVEKGEGANQHHLMQLWMYLYLTGVESGRLVYISKDDLAIQEYPVKLSDLGLQTTCLGTIELLNHAWRAQTPPKPPGWTWEGSEAKPVWKQRLDKRTGLWKPVVGTFKDWRANYCSYHEICGDIFKNKQYLSAGDGESDVA